MGVIAEQGCEAFPKPYLIMYKFFANSTNFIVSNLLLELSLWPFTFRLKKNMSSASDGAA